MNNKGFAATSILYTILVIFLLLMLGLLVMMSSRSILLNKLKKDIVSDISGSVTEERTIRIANASVLDSKDGTGEVSYDVSDNTITMSTNLTKAESTVTYQVTVVNSTNSIYSLTGLTEQEYTDKNMKYELSDGIIGSVIGNNSSKSFTVKLYYDKGTTSSDVSNKLVLKLNFEENKAIDLSGKKKDATLYNVTYASGGISFNGKNSYAVSDVLDYNNSTAFTIDFVAKIDSKGDTAKILFESSKNWNENKGSWGVTTDEYGTDGLALTTKFEKFNIKYSENIVDSSSFKHYTVSFDSSNEYNDFIKIYLEGKNIEIKVLDTGNHVENVSNSKFQNYPLYIGSRNGEASYSKMILKELRVYNKELTAEEIKSNIDGNLVKDGLILYYDFSNSVK